MVRGSAPGSGRITGVRRLWSEFKSFAMSGNMLDLALGFIIGAAFAKLIESLANNVFMQLVGAFFGTRDFTELKLTVNHANIMYGAFLTDLINFMMLAGVLFLIVKMIVWMGIGRTRVFGEKQCPYCMDKVAPNALICRACGQQLVAELPSLAEAERLLAEQHRRRITLPPLPVRPRRGGRPGNGGTRSADDGDGEARPAEEIGRAAGAAIGSAESSDA
jgi:large conductance mechanosensitive channel